MLAADFFSSITGIGPDTGGNMLPLFVGFAAAFHRDRHRPLQRPLMRRTQAGRHAIPGTTGGALNDQMASPFLIPTKQRKSIRSPTPMLAIDTECLEHVIHKSTCIRRALRADGLYAARVQQ